MTKLWKFDYLLPDRMSDEQFDIVMDLYRDAADEDYAVARHSWKVGWVRQFAWSANQAIEKYLKAGCLLNGRSAKFSHDWLDAFRSLSKLATDNGYVDLSILRPASHILETWAAACNNPYDETANDFVERLNPRRLASIRYKEHGFFRLNTYDLHKLDSLVHWLRGLCFPLDGELLLDTGQSGTPQPALFEFDQLLGRYPILLEANYSFCAGCEHDPLLRSGFISSPLNRRYKFEADDATDWLVARTGLRKDDIERMRQETETRRVEARQFLGDS